MKESEFEELSKEILVKIIPGSLCALEDQDAFNNAGGLTMEELIAAAKTTTGVSAGYAITFTRELLKRVLLKESIIEKD